MTKFRKIITLSLIVGAQFLPGTQAQTPAAGPTAEEIIQHCEYKPVGDDQKARMTLTNKNKEGLERKSIYRRFLRFYGGDDNQVLEKMLLFAEYPQDSAGIGFMRWEYVPEANRPPDQWLYTPSLRNVRRISVRDAGESFLGSTLALGDIGVRGIKQDKHTYLGIHRQGQKEYYVIESIPQEDNAIYSKRVSFYAKTPEWSQCYKEAVQYFDPKGFRLKTQLIRWQQVNGAWIWSHVEVLNHQTEQLSIFDLDEIELNTGLKDSLFEERVLRRGLDKIRE